MFKRRRKHNILRKAREMLWPSMGWLRATRYYRHRIGRLPGTPYFVAAGFATGVAVSCTPFMGLHMILGFLLAKLLGASVVATLLGTLVGNPWTFPFIWWGTYEIGQAVLGEAANGLPDTITWQHLWEDPTYFLWPMTVGGVPLAIAVWFLVYYPMRDLVTRYKAHRLKVLQRDLVEEFNEDA